MTYATPHNEVPFAELSPDTTQIVPIPSDNIQILKAGFDAFNSGDVDRIIEIVHPGFEGMVPPELSPEPDTYRGHDGIRRYFESFYEALDEIRFRPERFWDAGGNVVVVSMRVTGRGKQTSIPVEQRNAQVWTLRDGQLWRVMTYASPSDALAAAGLEPQAAEPAA